MINAKKALGLSIWLLILTYKVRIESIKSRQLFIDLVRKGTKNPEKLHFEIFQVVRHCGSLRIMKLLKRTSSLASCILGPRESHPSCSQVLSLFIKLIIWLVRYFSSFFETHYQVNQTKGGIVKPPNYNQMVRNTESKSVNIWLISYIGERILWYNPEVDSVWIKLKCWVSNWSLRIGGSVGEHNWNWLLHLKGI